MLNLRQHWDRARFPINDRLEFYETLTLWLDCHLQLRDALAEMVKNYSDDGKHPKRVRALVAQECLMGISSGKTFSATLAHWVSEEEFSLIEAGEQIGNLQAAFQKSVRIVQARREIGQAVATATLYPAFLFLQGAFLLQKIAVDLIPILGRSGSQEGWSFSARLLKWLSDFVVHFGAPVAIILAVCLLTIFVSLPILRGNLRVWLDKIPPWSIYRMMLGSTFLLNIGVLLGSGVKLNEALAKMASRANPWLRERLDATLYGVRSGANLGQSLDRTGFNFPDKRAVQFLRGISGLQGADQNMERFGERWLAQSIKSLKKTASLLLGLAILLNAGLMILVLVGTNGISQAVMAGMHG